MGDTKNWHLEVSVDVHSVQFVDGGQYVLVLTFDKDHRMGVHDLQISRDGVTFIEGHCLKSDILQQDQPEKTVETPNNLFVFRLPKGFCEDDDYSKLTLHLESYLLDTAAEHPADIGGAGDKGDDHQMKMSGLVYQKLGAGVIPLGKADSDTTRSHSTNVIPVRGISSANDVAGTIGSVKYTVTVQPVDSATAEKQHDIDLPVKGPDTATPGYDIDSPFTQYSATPEESAAASAASLRNMTFNNSTIVQKPTSCLARQGYLTDGLPLEYETLRMGVGGLACTVLTCVLPAFASNSLNKAKQRYHVTMADIYDVSPKYNVTQSTGSWVDVHEPEEEDQACFRAPEEPPIFHSSPPSSPGYMDTKTEVIPALPKVLPTRPEFGPAKPNVRPTNPEDPKNYPTRVTPHAVEVLYQHQQQELETRRQSVDLMNRDVSSLQSRLSALQNENDELKQTLCTCTSKQQVSVSNDISNAQETGSNVIIGGSLVKHDIARQPSSLPTNGDTQVGVVIKRSSPIIDHRPNYGSGAGVSTGGIDGVKQPNSAIYPNMTWDDNDYVIMESTAPAESRRQYGSSTGVNLGEIDVAKQPKPITSILRIQSEIDVAKAPKSTSSTGVNVGRINDVQLRSSQGERIYGNLGPSSAQISDGNSGGFDIAQKRHEITTGWVDFGGEAPPKTPNGTDVNLDEICKEYADMMDVRKFLPKGTGLPWSPSCDHPLDVDYATPLHKLQALQDMYKQQLVVVKTLRKKQNQKRIASDKERDNGGTSSSASDVSINIPGQMHSTITCDDETKMKILAKLDFLQTRITSLETELAKNTKAWENDKEKMEVKLNLRQVEKFELDRKPKLRDTLFEVPRPHPFVLTEGGTKPKDVPLPPVRPPHSPYPGQAKQFLPQPPSRPTEKSRPSPKSSAGRMFVQLYPVLSGYLSNSSSGTRVGKSPRPPKSPRQQKSPRLPRSPRSPKSPRSRRDRRETAYLRPVSNVPRLPSCCDASNLLPRPNPSRSGKVTIIPENPPKPAVNLPRPTRKQLQPQPPPNPRTTWRY